MGELRRREVQRELFECSFEYVSEPVCFFSRNVFSVKPNGIFITKGTSKQCF